MLAHEDGDHVDRREFLVAGVAGLAHLLSPEPLRPLKPLAEPEHVAALDALRLATAAQRRLEATAPSEILMPAVTSHVELAAGLVRAAPSDQTRQESARALSELSGFAAWLHLDLDDTAAAQRRYAVAARGAELAVEPLLRCYMLGSLAQLHLDHGDAGEAERLVAAARRLVSAGTSPTVDAWLLGIQAVATSSERPWNRTAKLLRRVSEFSDGAEHETPPWPWMTAFDRAKAASCRATCALRAGRYAEVHHAAEAAGPGLRSVKQRALLQLDRAEADLHLGDVSSCFHRAADVLSVGHDVRSRRIVARCRGLRRQYRGRTIAAVRRFDGQLRVVTVDPLR
jgi:hypothetical protein